jgi:capsular exopolysaccharide synthesis family protein
MIPGLNKRVFNLHDLMLYLALACKHLRLMILLICMSLLLGVAAFIYSRPVYFSRSIIRVDELALPVDSDSVFHDSSLGSIISELQSPTIVERTARRLGVNAGYREIQAKYLKQLRITQSPEADGRLEVEVYAYEKSWPARWTSLMVDEFLKEREEAREKYRASVIRSWGDVIGDAGQKMDANLDDRFDSQDQSKLIGATMDMNRLHDLPVQLVQIQQQIERFDEVVKKLDDPNLETVAKLSLIDSVSAETELRVGQVVGQSGTGSSGAGDEMAPAAAVGESIVEPGLVVPTDWQLLDKDERRIEREIAEASRIYLPGNRKMIALNAQLQAVRANLELDYQSARSRLEMQRQSLVDQEQDLEKKLPEYQAINHKYAKLQQDSQLHSAGQIAWQSIYTDAEKYINELEYTADKERVNLQYLGIADLKPEPVSPNRVKFGIMSLLLGLGLAVAVPFLIEYLDFTLSNMNEVEATFQMRGLGIIPQLEKQENQPSLINISNAEGEHDLVENFRLVRTNLLAMGALSKAPDVLMITSAMPREGKTVVSSNLALSFAQMGEKVLLVDTDLRRGRLHRLFGLRKSPGLSDLLLDKVTLPEVLRPSGAENLAILSAGEHLQLGTELLGSQKFTDLMRELRGRYDRIIMDTPPVLGLSETSILQNHVDGVLFVIWSGRTPIRTMKTAVDILASNGANFYGFVLNRLDLTSMPNYYQYYYYSSDYYHSYHSTESV